MKRFKLRRATTAVFLIGSPQAITRQMFAKED
jgi:hypothetical protein